MKYLLLLSMLILIGCGHTPEEVIVEVPVFVPVVCEDFGTITPIRPLPVKFVIGVDEQGNNVLGLRGDQYSNLSINSAETLRYIKEQKQAIVYYKTCIVDHNTKQKKGGP